MDIKGYEAAYKKNTAEKAMSIMVSENDTLG